MPPCRAACGCLSGVAAAIESTAVNNGRRISGRRFPSSFRQLIPFLSSIALFVPAGSSEGPADNADREAGDTGQRTVLRRLTCCRRQRRFWTASGPIPLPALTPLVAASHRPKQRSTAPFSAVHRAGHPECGRSVVTKAPTTAGLIEAKLVHPATLCSERPRLAGIDGGQGGWPMHSVTRNLHAPRLRDGRRGACSRTSGRHRLFFACSGRSSEPSQKLPKLGSCQSSFVPSKLHYSPTCFRFSHKTPRSLLSRSRAPWRDLKAPR